MTLPPHAGRMEASRPRPSPREMVNLLPARQRHLADVPAGGAELLALQATVWDTARDPQLLELCRLRVAALLRDEDASQWRSPPATAAGLDEGKVDALEDWRSSPLFDARERAYIDFTEQFVTSVRHVSDEQVAALCAHDDDESVREFVSALYALETIQRAALVSTTIFLPSAGA